jgi:hypothetical protein
MKKPVGKTEKSAVKNGKMLSVKLNKPPSKTEKSSGKIEKCGR